MKSLYQTTLEQFTGTQELKEGDYVVCPMFPNEVAMVSRKTNGFLYVNFKSCIYYLISDGRQYIQDQFPLFLKCSPPKKKVEKVFEVTLWKDPDSKCVYVDQINEKFPENTRVKAKLIVEAEE